MIRLAVTAVALLACTTAAAQTPRQELARPLEGRAFSATLKSIEGGKVLFQVEGKQQTIPLEGLLLWGSPADVRRGPYVLLSDGSRIAGEVISITSDALQIESRRRPSLWLPSRLPRAAVHAIVYQMNADPEVQEQFETSSLEGGGQDRLLLVSGDALSGTLLESLSPDTEDDDQTLRFRFQPTGAKQPLTVPQDRVQAISLRRSTASAARERQLEGSTPFWIGLDDGSVLLTSRLTLDDKTVFIELLSGGTLQTDAVDEDVEPPEPFWQRVVLLQPLPERVVYISDLRTIGFKHVPLFEWQREYANDRSVAGSRLRTGGRRYLKGIGMPGTSRLAYEVPEDATRFEAEIALDDASGRHGSVLFRVYLESSGGVWKPAFESQVLRAGEPAQSVRVDLGSAKRLALVVDMADHGDMRDWADWLNARFIK